MSELLMIRGKVRDFLRKYDEITTPVFRFVLSLIMFNTINSLFGYSDLFEQKMMVFLLALICALVPNEISVLLGGVVVLVNTVCVSNEVALSFAVLFLVMYCVYMRMFKECSWVLALIPVLYSMNLFYVAPLIVIMIAGISGIVPAAFGVILFYFAKATKDIESLIQTAESEDEIKAFNYFIDNVIKNKEVWCVIIALSIVIAAGYVIYRLPVDYGKYIGIVAGGVLNIICFPIADAAMEVETVSFGSLILGSVLGILIAVIIQICKGLVDYSRKEVVQFEDDEYYYYVKAVPKFDVPVENKKVKKITEGTGKEQIKKQVNNKQI